MIDWAWMPPPLRRLMQRLLSPRVLRFAAVGFSGVFINLGTLFVLSELVDLRDEVASPLAIEVSIIWNFFLNNAWTFADKNEAAQAGFATRLVRYNLVSLVGLAIQFVVFLMLKNAAIVAFQLTEAGIWKYPSQLVGIAIAMAWNFLSNFWWTWAPASASTRVEPAPAPAVSEPERP